MRFKKYIHLFCISLLFHINTNIEVNAATQAELEQQLISETAVLINGETGRVLFDMNMHQKMYPASITKILTALLALENADLSDTITMSHEAVFSVGRHTSHIALDIDEELTLEQALYAIAIVSANDASNGIAEHISGTMDSFAKQMTDRAKEAGALNSNFVNAHGLPDENHYTTAYDMARIMMEAILLPRFSEIFNIPYHEMPPTNIQTESRYFWNKNAMMVGNYLYDGVIAGKSGWTTDAQHTLVTAAQRDGRTLIAVVMNSPNPTDKWKDSIALFDYGFNTNELFEDFDALEQNSSVSVFLNLGETEMPENENGNESSPIDDVDAIEAISIAGINNTLETDRKKSKSPMNWGKMMIFIGIIAVLWFVRYIINLKRRRNLIELRRRQRQQREYEYRHYF